MVTHAEKFDILLIYGECQMNARRAMRLYGEREIVFEIRMKFKTKRCIFH